MELTPTPPANTFVPENLLAYPQRCYPLNVYFCVDCGHVQLLDIIDPGDLFTEYVYVSGTSPANVEHFRCYAEQVIANTRLEPGNLVVEIGSNDGTMLRFFKDAGMRVLGVDPARSIAEAASAQGIETLAEFFTPQLCERIREVHGTAAVVIANNVCAHIDDLQSVMRGVRSLLEPQGSFVMQVSYLLDVHRGTLFDTMYHEHVDYHRVGPLRRFFDRMGMRMWDSQRVDAQGGSLRAYAGLADAGHPVRDGISAMEEAEREAGLDNPQTLRAFWRQIERCKVELTALLEGLKSRGLRIAAYGAPAKATTLMHHFSLDGSTIDFIVEDNPLKQGLYTPGLHVPVLATEQLYERAPDYVVVLAWNFAPSIIVRHRVFSERGGRFIVPLPSLQVL